MNVTDRLSGNRCDSWIGALAVLFLGVFVFPTLAFSQNTITLPIEVYPDDGRSNHVESVEIRASNGSQADSIFFQMHQPHYHKGGWATNPNSGFDPQTMVDVRTNGGSWVSVRNSNVDCAYPENNYACIAGGYSTVRFAMSASQLGGLVDGANTVEFRFNGTEGVRSGFRILHIGFMRPGDNVETFVPLPKTDATDTIIDESTFEYWDPDSWTAPAGYGDAQYVSAGDALWSSENTLVDLDGTSIVAACGSCHATDGRDLQYFAFSNKTIVARSQSHGLTEDEGKKIAAYIRSLSFTHTDGTPATTSSPGTPWDPPYQPGPTGFGPDENQHPDDADPYYWAAGAGLDWVLEHDLETTQYAFPASGNPANPGGTQVNADGSLPWTRYKLQDESEWGGNGGVNRGTAINMREIPVSVQFPDWNNYLPDIHPHDGIPAQFDGSDVESMFENAESVFQGGDPNQVNSFITNAQGEYQNEIKQGGIDRDNPSSVGNPSLTVNQLRHAITSGLQWRATKVWYLQHKYTMEDKADDLFCGSGELEWCEPLGWLGNMRTLFEMAPHVSGSGDNDPPYVYGTEAANDFYSHVWYQIQMVVNPGTPGNTGIVPVDEGYQEAFLQGACNMYNVPCGIRQIISEWKLWQMYSNDRNGRGGVIPGNVNMDEIFSVVKTGDRKAKYWDQLTKTPEGKTSTRRWLEAFFRATNTYMVGEPYSSQAGRIGSIERLSSGWDNRGFTWPSISYDPPGSGVPNEKNYTDWIYRAMKGTLYEQEEGLANFFPDMSRGTLDSLAAQGDLITPDNRDDGFPGEVSNGWSLDTRWHDLVDYTPPSTGSQTIGLAQGWNLISSRINPSDPAIESVFGGIDSDLSLVKNEAGDIYSPGVGLNNIGDWQSREGYLVYMTNSQSMSVNGYGVDPTTSFMLEEGWNLIPYYPDTGVTPEDAFASISSELVMVKNQAGETYVPDPQDPIDDIGQLQPGEAYKVYVSSPVSFSYPSTN
jgi:cytochrome c553